MRLSKGLIKADIVAAGQAIDYFDKKGIKDIKNVAAYHLQQASEKLIKYQMYQQIGTVDNRRMYTHDLSKLIDYAMAENLTIFIPDYIREHANRITEWEAGSRYDIGFSVRIDTLKRCYEIVKDWEKRLLD